MDIIIRKIQAADIKDFHQALETIAEEGVYLLTVPPVPFDKIESFILGNIENDNAQYIARHQGQLIGWADITPYSRATITHVGSLGMAILPEYRGQGLGSALLEKTIEHAWQQGLQRIELEVFSDNIAAIKLYQKMGFEIEGTRKYARLHNGRYQHMHIMAQYRI